MDSPERPLLQSGRKAKILLHSGKIQRLLRAAVAQQGQRHFSGGDQRGRPPGCDVERPGCGRAGREPGFLAGPGACQRHTAEPPLHQQRQRNFYG